jgi:uncharacterized phage-associated protein
MVYKALDISKYIIRYEAEQGRAVSNLRLQKLLYFIQARFLVSKNEPCFFDKMEAWDFGPVVPTVYHEFKFFGSSGIPLACAEGGHEIYDEDKELIKEMLDYCSKLSTSALVSRTHNQRPWKEAYRRLYDNTIYIDSVKKYFS